MTHDKMKTEPFGKPMAYLGAKITQMTLSQHVSDSDKHIELPLQKTMSMQNYH